MARYGPSEGFVFFRAERNMNQRIGQVKKKRICGERSRAYHALWFTTLLLTVGVVEGCRQSAVQEKASHPAERSSVKILAPATPDGRWRIRTKTAEFQILASRSANAFLLTS